MGKYLDFGIAREIVADLKEHFHTYIAEEVINDFFKTADRNLYDVKITDDGRYVYFNLKDELLVKYGIDLIKEQYEKYIITPRNEEIIKALDDLNSKTDEEKLEIINEKSYYYLQDIEMGWYGYDTSGFFTLPVNAYITDLLAYYDSNKTFMEESDEFLRYVRNLLINSTDNPLRTALTLSV